MKAKIFISRLRAVTEVAALVVFILIIASILIWGYSATQEMIFRFWPSGALLLIAYMVLSITEDYLNKRIFYNYSSLS